MFNDRKVVIIGSIIYISCLYLAFILYSPGLSVTAIKQAMQQKDVESLDDYIDFNSLQQSVTAQLKTELILKATVHQSLSKESRPQFMEKVSYANSVVEDFIELFVSKNGISRLLEMDNKDSATHKTLEAQKVISSLQSESLISDNEFELKSLNTFEVKGYNDTGKQHKLVFTFRYTQWVLTDIIMDLSDVDAEKVIGFIKGFQLG